MLIKDDSFRRLCRAREILAHRQSDPQLSIEDIAESVGISPFHFIRQFDAMFGTTPHQFRIAERLDRAKRLLVTGELPVTEVCLEVGFSSLGSFSHMFRRRLGIAPSEYARRGRSMVAVPGEIPRIMIPGCLSLMEDAFRSFREA